MLKILFIGDLYGKLGRETLRKLLPKIRRQHKPDLVIINAENMAHGSGVTEVTVKEILDLGVDFITLGDHAFDRPEQAKACFELGLPLIRPANLPPSLPGRGHALIETKHGPVLVINLLGRVNMPFQYDCPFRGLDAILKDYKDRGIKPAATLVDFHAETTAEKVCFGHYADGQVSAVLGTHTHVPTADARLLPRGTAYITDVGMTGAYNESIGLDLENAIKTLVDQIKYPRVIPDQGKTSLSAVLLSVDPAKRKAKSLEQLQFFADIK